MAAFAESTTVPRVYFYTSNIAKYLQAKTIFDRCGLGLQHFRSRQDPYDEAYDQGRSALLESAIASVKSVVGRTAFFFVEDTSIVIPALSNGPEEFPGLRAKEWFADTTFEELDDQLNRAGDRRAEVRSDIALHVPGRPSPRIFTGRTSGTVALEPPQFSPNASYPWLTPETFNGWFVPQGMNVPLGSLPLEASLEVDFRVKSLMEVVEYLEEATYALNLPAHAVDRVERTFVPSGVQSDLFGDLSTEKQILMVIGHTCAGKTEFGKVAANHPEAHHIEASEVLRSLGLAEELRLPGAEMASSILRRLGPDAVARRIVERELPLVTRRSVVITGFRTIEEVASIKRSFPRARLLFLRASDRTRYQRQIQRKRPDAVQTMDDFRAKGSRQEMFGLLPVGEVLADDHLENEGTSDETLLEYESKVAAILRGDDHVPGLTKVVRPRYGLERERLYRCLLALREQGVPLTASEISARTADSGKRIEQRNVNQALKDYPQFAERRESDHGALRYEITRSGLAYVRLREDKAAAIGRD